MPPGRDLKHSLSQDVSISVAGHFSLSLLAGAIDDNLETAIDNIPSLRGSPEAQDLKRERTRYKVTFNSDEYNTC